jgi:hypothetical protein
LLTEHADNNRFLYYKGGSLIRHHARRNGGLRFGPNPPHKLDCLVARAPRNDGLNARFQRPRFGQAFRPKSNDHD